MVFNLARTALRSETCSNMAIHSRSGIGQPRDLCLGDRTLPSIVLGDWHNLRQLIRTADLDYTE
jgi:hypothetical protein